MKYLIPFMTLPAAVLFISLTAANTGRISHTGYIKLPLPQTKGNTSQIKRDSAYANPYSALLKLKEGNLHFMEGRTIAPKQDHALAQKLAAGQKPFAVIVDCSDSRVSPEILFNSGLGDLFVLRTAGQVMAEASYGSIEYACLNLKTKLIVVMGHSHCGAVEAAANHSEHPPGHLGSLISAIKPAVETAKKMNGDLVANAVKQNVINQVHSLQKLASVLSKGYDSGDILIVGAVYSLATGNVEFLKETMQGLPHSKYHTNKLAVTKH